MKENNQLQPDKNLAKFNANTMFIGADGRYNLNTKKQYSVRFILLLDSGRVQIHLPTEKSTIAFIEYESWIDSQAEWRILSIHKQRSAN